MQKLGGYKKTMQMSLFGFFAAFLLLPLVSNAQVPELTGTSTETLLGPGVAIDTTTTAPEPVSGADPETIIGTTIVEQSRYGKYERAIIKAVDQITTPTKNGTELRYNYTVQILTGDFKNKTFSVRNPSTDSINPSTGDIIMIFVQPGGNDEPQIFFESYDRKNIYIFSVLILLILLLIFFGLRGLMMAGVIAITLWLAIYTTIPLYLRDWPLLLVMTLTAILLSVISSLMLFGWHKKVITTTIATTMGTIVTTIIAQIFAGAMHLTAVSNSISQAFFKDHPTIDPAKLILIGLILACFAIIQDLASSISCGVAELKKIRKNATWKDLFTSGMNIGRSHVATMALVLVLTWIGASIYIFLFRYQNDTGWLHFLNQDSVSATFLLAIAGTIGIISSVPISSLISAIAWTRITPPEDPSKPIPSWKLNNQ
ncbi:MAG: YibE/F family protein [Patescibacteria group bacterium]|nr:YibE/F family protein [Patescibacteria group bacterium]